MACQSKLLFTWPKQTNKYNGNTYLITSIVLVYLTKKSFYMNFIALLHINDN